MWIDKYTWGSYKMDDFLGDIEQILEDLHEFYKLLHAYVREKLKKHEDYGDHFEDDGLIPAHILGRTRAISIFLYIYHIH